MGRAPTRDARRAAAGGATPAGRPSLCSIAACSPTTTQAVGKRLSWRGPLIRITATRTGAPSRRSSNAARPHVLVDVPEGHAEYIQRSSRRVRHHSTTPARRFRSRSRWTRGRISARFRASFPRRYSPRRRGAHAGPRTRAVRKSNLSYTNSKRVTTNRLCRSCTLCGARAGCHAVEQLMHSQARCQRLEARPVATPMRRRGAADQ